MRHFHLDAGAYSIFSRLRTAVWIFDIDKGHVVWGNEASLEIWAADSLEELVSRDMGRDMSQSVAQRLAQYREDFITSDAVFSENWSLYPKGKPLTLRVIHSGVVLEDGRMAMLCEGMEKQSVDNETLRSAEALLHTKVMITLFADDGHALYRNPAARAVVSDIGETFPQHFVDSGVYEMLASELKQSGASRVVAAVNTKAEICWHEVAARFCYDAVTGNPATLVSEVDVTELKRTQERALHLTTHDVVTELYNRKYVMENFPRFLDLVREEKFEGALLLIDIDYFKYVNESVGHEKGERVLVEVANRLRSCMIDSQDQLARLGGDEFLVQTMDKDIDSRVRKLLKNVQEKFSRPFHVANRSIPITLSTGVVFFPKDGLDATTLMKRADLSVYHAKNHGRNRVSYYDPSFEMAGRADIFHDGALHAALENREFTIHLQPRVHVHSGRIVGAEALARWNSPRYGMVSPDVFISACEEFGLILELGAQMFELAAIEQKKYLRQGRPLTISVNISPYQLKDPGLVQTIEKIMNETGCSPNHLEFEITESAMPEDNETVTQAINAIQRMGFRFFIDDFGTGYSNLSHIQKYPFSGLKIDRSFVNVEAEQRKLAEMIVMMAQAMSYNTVAEGIETEEQLEWLRQREVDEYQGFFFSKPLDREKFAVLLRNEDAELNRQKLWQAS
ncbi:MAG: bifunctional diguanylate cyclase/phosphodiesterase [Candidatus Accumulibacter sp.]|jgi:diguanylate cyclase (GGDEF)-like protein|nr:bifunctional diguanylate cyclase/phosphodiesterase [Accumulibacter sp.]